MSVESGICSKIIDVKSLKQSQSRQSAEYSLSHLVLGPVILFAIGICECGAVGAARHHPCGESLSPAYISLRSLALLSASHHHLHQASTFSQSASRRLHLPSKHSVAPDQDPCIRSHVALDKRNMAETAVRPSPQTAPFQRRDSSRQNSRNPVSDDPPSEAVMAECAPFPIYDADGEKHRFDSLYTGTNRRDLVIFVRHFFCGVSIVLIQFVSLDMFYVCLFTDHSP